MKKRQTKRIFGNMIYSIELTFDAEQDIERYKKSGDKKILIKMDKLLNELREHPTNGTGKPDQLKFYGTLIS